jgi:hypothetical protein
MIQIHQFSTGIKADRDKATGQWFSRGFTGQFMNATLEIPEAVQRSIRNKEFAVAEGAYSDEPAVVGRVVLGEDLGEPNWAVVATVTKGRDEYDRPFSAYRYFLAQGAENLKPLAVWLEQQPRLPVFEPFDLAQEISFTPVSQIPPDLSGWQNWLRQEAVPCILPSGTIDSGQRGYLQMIHAFAAEKVQGRSIAWAFNVEALEQPQRFTVVQAASARAEEMIRKAIANKPQQSAVAAVTDDQAIRSAVKSLTNSSQVKPEAVQTIGAAMANSRITADYWEEVFDAQGAKKAVKQKIFSPQMVRLLTLRSLVLPKTLPEFLRWLNPQLKGKSEHCDTSLEFQRALYQQLAQQGKLGQIDHLFSQGAEALLIQIMSGNLANEAAIWAVSSEGSVWARHRLVDNVAHDLTTMRSATGNSINRGRARSSTQARVTAKPEQPQAELTYGNGLWKNLRCEPLAVFFGNLAEMTSSMQCAQVASYFYHSASGQVPDSVFKLAFPLRRRNALACGLEVRKEVTFLESAWFLLCSYGVYLLIPLLITGTGFLIVDILKDVKASWNPLYRRSQQEPPSTNTTDSPDTSLSYLADIAKDAKDKNVASFLSLLNDEKHLRIKSELSSAADEFYESNTCEQIRKIVTDGSKDESFNKSETEVQEELIGILKLDKNKDQELFNNDCKTIPKAANSADPSNQLAKQWVAGIYLYQLSRNFSITAGSEVA